MSKRIAALAASALLVGGVATGTANAAIPIDDETPLVAQNGFTIADPDGDGYGVGVAKIGRTGSYNPATTNNDFCGEDVSFDVEVTDKGRDLLGLKIIDPGTGELKELVNVPAPSECMLPGANGPDPNNPNTYVEVEMTSNGLGGRSAVYEVFIVRNGVRNAPDPYSTEFQPVSSKLGYVTGATVSNPLVFDATGTADIPAIDLAAADGTVALNAQRISGSPLSDCDTAKTAGVFVQDNTNTGTLLWVKPQITTPKGPGQGGYSQAATGCETSLFQQFRLAGFTAGTDADGLLVQVTSSTPSGTKFWMNQKYNLDASGTLVTTAPVVTIEAPADGETYPLGSVPAAAVSCVEDESSWGRNADKCVESGYSDQPGTHTMTVTSLSWGGTTTESVTYTVVEGDTTKPVIDITSPADGATYTESEAAGGLEPQFTCTDDDSPVSSCTQDGFSTAIGTHTMTVTGESEGGTATATVTYTVEADPDVTGPVINISNPVDGGEYTESEVSTDFEPVFTCTDDESAVTACEQSGFSTDLGTHTMTVTGTSEGGSESASVTYTVVPDPPVYEFTDFSAPVDAGVVNEVKGGKTVPMKFQVFTDGVEVTDPALVSFSMTNSDQCDGTLSSEPVEFTTTGATSLRYDADAGLFVQNWKSPKRVGCYEVSVSADGASVSALFATR